MINKKELKQEYFTAFIGEIEDALRILEFAVAMAVKDGGEEHNNIIYHLKRIISSGKVNINQGRWIQGYARKHKIFEQSLGSLNKSI